MLCSNRKLIQGLIKFIHRSGGSQCILQEWGVVRNVLCLEYTGACLVAQSCPTLRDTIDCSMPGSSVPGTLQARTLEWVAISSSRGSPQPRDQTRKSCLSCSAGDQGFNQSLGQEDPLKKGMATYSSILSWRVPGTEEPGMLHSMELQESDTTECLTLSLLRPFAIS